MTAFFAQPVSPPDIHPMGCPCDDCRQYGPADVEPILTWGRVARTIAAGFLTGAIAAVLHAGSLRAIAAAVFGWAS